MSDIYNDDDDDNDGIPDAIDSSPSSRTIHYISPIQRDLEEGHIFTRR